MITSSRIKSLATALGFDACGIVRVDSSTVGAGSPRPGEETSPLRFGEDVERLKRWVSEGRHGEMKYLEDFDQRAKKFWENFPEAKSVIVVGVNYYSRSSVIARSPSAEEIPRPSLRAPRSGAKQSPASEQAPQSTSSEIASAASATTHGGPAAPFGGYGGLAKTTDSGPQDDCVTGRVARYAWGKDYHKVIGKRLEEFREKLVTLVGRPIRGEICVDTKPLLERSLAQRAGLGFIGKQSQLLSPEFGPWLFLGELVTDLELEPDEPFVGDCGTCTICIDQCPTDAIRPEGGIDARRCISYLTIEHKSEIPAELRPLVGDWVFGCDLCLEVCPFTSKAKETRWPQFRAESGFGPRLDLLKLSEIPSNRTYEKYFEGTAILRARRKQLLRNAKVVIENVSENQSTT